jgi:hypothetical protein
MIEITPTCESTGLPLPVAINELLPGAHLLFWDYHHHFHPRKDAALRDISGLAVRVSRGQFLPRYLHNRYHATFSGPELPLTDSDKFKTTILACAGVVPRQALQIYNNSQYEVQDLDEEAHAQLVESKTIYIEGVNKNRKFTFISGALSKFFIEFAIAQDIRQAVSERVIGEFIEKNISPERRLELGNFILSEALGITVDNLEPIKRGLDEEGLVAVRGRSLQSTVRKFAKKNHFPAYHKRLMNNLENVA